jgi:lincosamide nucleotidyltransferase A/C/D/E
MMHADDVLAILHMLEQRGVTVWLDGGWGVDALLGQQTRPHDDLDLVIPFDLIPTIEATLAVAGFVLTEDEKPTRFVLRDDHGRCIDFHPVIFDAQGDGLQRLQDGSDFHYPAAGFTGSGLIAQQSVRCITAAAQVLCHLGYEPDEKDVHDMYQLTTHFQLSLPAPYDVLIKEE